MLEEHQAKMFQKKMFHEQLYICYIYVMLFKYLCYIYLLSTQTYTHNFRLNNTTNNAYFMGLPSLWKRHNAAVEKGTFAYLLEQHLRWESHVA